MTTESGADLSHDAISPRAQRSRRHGFCQEPPSGSELGVRPGDCIGVLSRYRTLPLRFILLPALVSLTALAVSWRYVYRVLRSRSREAERDPLGPSDDVVMALGRTQAMKVSTEAEALAYAGGR